eukprot:10198_6
MFAGAGVGGNSFFCSSDLRSEKGIHVSNFGFQPLKCTKAFFSTSSTFTIRDGCHMSSRMSKAVHLHPGDHSLDCVCQLMACRAQNRKVYCAHKAVLHLHTHTHTQAHTHTSTQTHKHTNTQAHKHTNTPAHRLPNHLHTQSLVAERVS